MSPRKGQGRENHRRGHPLVMHSRGAWFADRRYSLVSVQGQHARLSPDDRGTLNYSLTYVVV